MKHAAGLARVRHLSSLGMPGGIFISAALPLVERVFPRTLAKFTWVDANGAAATTYWSAASEIEAPTSREEITFRVEILADDRRRIGFLELLRDPARSVFGLGEIQYFEPLARYIASGLACADAAPAGQVLYDQQFAFEQGTIVCTAAGEVVHSSDLAGRLVALATGAPVLPGQTLQLQGRARALLQDLPAEAVNGCLPITRHLTKEGYWGQFCIHISPLRSSTERYIAPLWAVSVQRRLPLVLRVAEALERARLSPQQSRIGLLMMAGKSNRLIGDTLGISINTVAYHAKCLFAKLEVADRSELLLRLVHLRGNDLFANAGMSSLEQCFVADGTRARTCHYTQPEEVHVGNSYQVG